MAVLLRKVWESVSNRPSPSAAATNFESVTRRSSSASSSSASSLLSLGFFDRLPIDVLVQIVRLVGPEDAARLSVASKSWRSLVSDNRLWIFFLQDSGEPWTWDSVFFAEMNLRSGYPLRTFPSHLSTELSLMRIYGERRKVPGAVIIDGGSGYCKFGWSKFDSPSGRTATFLEFGNIESPMYSRLRHFFATIYSRMQVKASTQPVVLSLPICHYDDTEAARASRRQLKGAIHTALFDMNVPSVCAVNQNMCYVAYDYQAELRKDTSASLELPGEGQFTLSTERFKTGEILFQPRLAGVRTMGLHQAISLCMDHCDSAELTGDDSWFKTVVLSGGTACLPGLAERLDKEVRQLVHPSLCKGFKVVPPTYGVDTAWFGAKLVSNVRPYFPFNHSFGPAFWAIL
ncbi:Actin-related protein 8 [Linum perenne]